MMGLRDALPGLAGFFNQSSHSPASWAAFDKSLLQYCYEQIGGA